MKTPKRWKRDGAGGVLKLMSLGIGSTEPPGPSSASDKRVPAGLCHFPNTEPGVHSWRGRRAAGAGLIFPHGSPFKCLTQDSRVHCGVAFSFCSSHLPELPASPHPGRFLGNKAWGPRGKPAPHACEVLLLLLMRIHFFSLQSWLSLWSLSRPVNGR